MIVVLVRMHTSSLTHAHLHVCAAEPMRARTHAKGLLSLVAATGQDGDLDECLNLAVLEREGAESLRFC